MISELVRQYENQVQKRLNDISTAALVVEGNIRKAFKSQLTKAQEEGLLDAISDLKLIQNELTKMNFKLEENKK